MKTIKLLAKVLGVIILLGGLFVGFVIGKRFYNSYAASESLESTVLGIEIEPNDLEDAKELRQGEIHSKRAINLSEIPPLWEKISENGTLKDEYTHLNGVNFFAITYKSDSLLVNGIVAEPKKEGKFPVIIFNRGGNKEIGKMAKAKTLYTLIFAASALVEEGYVLLASCYREEDEFGGKDINDVLNLAETAKEMEKADPSRIGMFGWSRGGMMTYLALQKSGRFTTAVVGNGPTDLAQLILERPEMETGVCAKLIPDYQNKKEAELKKRSVIHWADELNQSSSLLILCGTEDKRVNPNQAEEIAKKLTDIDYDFELRKFETDHSFSNKKQELNEALIQWFNAKL